MSNSVNYEGIADAAIEYANHFGKNLDYSEKSISDLEEVLQYYFEEFQKDNTTENQMWNISVIFSVYLGQALLKNSLAEKNFYWFLDKDNVPVLKKDDGNIMSPVVKTYKRLKYGPEDSVKSFYNVAIAIAKGELK